MGAMIDPGMLMLLQQIQGGGGMPTYGGSNALAMPAGMSIFGPKGSPMGPSGMSGSIGADMGMGGGAAGLAGPIAAGAGALLESIGGFVGAHAAKQQAHKERKLKDRSLTIQQAANNMQLLQALAALLSQKTGRL